MLVHRIYKTLNRYFIRRKIPYGIISVRYLLPFQSEAVRQHRQWMFSQFPKWPTALWLPLNLCLWLRWQCWYGPYFIYKAHQKNACRITKIDGVHPIIQWWQLYCLSLLHTIPPSFYYQYKLYQSHRRKQLWQYVYEHELPGYHHAQSLSLANNTIEKLQKQSAQLSNKPQMIQRFIKQGIPTTPVLKTLEQLSLSVLTTLKQNYPSAVFIKPVQANQSQSAFKLTQTKQCQCQIQVIGELAQTQSKIIENYCQRMSETGPWMVQLFLQNHPTIQALLASDEAVSLRYISQRTENGIQKLSSYLEIPYTKDDAVYYCPLSIDHQGKINSGDLSLTELNSNELLLPIIDAMRSITIPHWRELEQYAKQAHTSFTAIRAIAWDFVITPQGPVLLEGNVNWRVGPMRNQLRALIFTK